MLILWRRHLTHVTRKGAPLPLGIGALRCTRIGMRVWADAHGLLRACSEDASGRPLGLDLDHKSREVIFGSRIAGAKIRAEVARKRAAEPAREADRAEAEGWSIQMEGYGGPAQLSPTIGQCLSGGLPPGQMPPVPHRGQHSARTRPPAA
jgi:hypothetical protein